MATKSRKVNYPDSDGKPMGDNTLQIKWMWKLYDGLIEQYRDDPNVLIACNLLWYPVEGNNRLRVAPDVMVALGRPAGERGSYQQWEEGGQGPTVVFEIMSPSNRAGELRRKFTFFEQYGAQEYYLYDPSRFRLRGWQRERDRLQPVPNMEGWVSPKLGIRFDSSAGELRVFSRTGREFLFSLERLAREEQEKRLAAEIEKQRAAAFEKELSDLKKQRADEAEQERVAKEALTAKLRELGLDLDALTKS